MKADKRQEIYRTMVQEEREFVLRIGWCVAVAALLCGAYMLYSAARYDVPVVVGLESAELSDQRAAFDALKDLNFFSGIKRPEPLIPQGDPVLEGLGNQAIIEIFVKGSAFISLKPASGRSLQHFLDKADAGKLTEQVLAEAAKEGPEFRLYLELRAQSFDPGVIGGDRLVACQRYAPCVAGVLQRRYPTAYNALVLLYRYAHSKEFTTRTIGYAKRNIGHFVTIRDMAFEKGFPPLKSDKEILKALRQVQNSSVHNTLISAVFLAFMALLFLGSAYRSSLWKDALARGWVVEES